MIFSAKTLNALLLSGLARENAYKIVQSHAMDAWHNDLDFRDLIKKDPIINTNLPPDELANLFNIEDYLTHIEDSFLRVEKLGYL